MLETALARYRRAGAELPFLDPSRDHGAAFEGYYWRFTDPGRGRVVVALCGVSALRDARWALVGVAAHPLGVVRSAILPGPSGDGERFGVEVDGAVSATSRQLEVSLPDAKLRVEIAGARAWPRRAFGGSGPAQAIPGLPQYWHPCVVGGRAHGELVLAGERLELDGATSYVERNWGPVFPRRWWWGQADAFEGDDVCVAFAGGPITVAGVALAPTVVAIRLGSRLLALSPPRAVSAAEVGEHGWRLRARSLRHRLLIEGEAADSAVALPVPVPGRRAAELRSHQALAGNLRIELRRRARTLFRGESRLAGLEREREVRP